MRLFKSYSALLLFILAFVLVYLLTLPLSWMISDSYSYFNQAQATAQWSYTNTFVDPISGNSYNQWGTPYALGNAHWIALFNFIFKDNYIFLSSLIACIIAVIFTYAAILKSSYGKAGIAILICYLPFQFFAKTLMSDVPSLALSSLFLYLLVSLQEDGRKWLILCALASFSIWFRESNILLLGGICLFNWAIHRKYFLFYFLGALLGLIPRLLSSYYAYGDPFFYVLSEPFQFDTFFSHLGIYTILSCIFIPGGLYFLAAFKGLFYKELKVAILCFLLFYIFYAYTAVSL